MKKLLTLVSALLIFSMAKAQSLYIRSFGKNTDPAIIFLHGGPGYNGTSFEGTTAKRLADSGFFVIVYDRRGEGRSKDATATYTFEQTFTDLDNIYTQFGLKKASLIGHSFGGIVGVRYAEAHPEKINRLFLVGAPVSLQTSFKQIIARCADIYKTKNDSANLSYIGMLQKMDTSLMTYGSFCFMHAMQNGFYAPKKSTAERTNIYAAFKTDTLSKYAGQMTYEAPQGFWKNEHYTTMDLTASIDKLVTSKMKVYGLYGKEDGLYAPSQVESLSKQLNGQLLYLEDCSHSVFIDRQTEFITAIKRWSKD